jgi:2-polyprenyl-6-methoxyphenol hydroxylase-like FAD-dependent oxidoreductase
MLAFLLARQGISVMLLETHGDFDRDFRGDTLHPSVMGILDQVGLAEKLLQIPHTKMHNLTMQTPIGTATIADFSRLKVKYPFITVLPQVKFLEFIATEAQQYPNFQLLMGANVQELVEADGTVRGVRYRGHGGWHEVSAKLTVACDGRFSRLRQLAGFETIKTAPPMDILWFRLPHQTSDVEGLGVGGRIRGGHMLVIIDRRDYWQLGYVILKGSYHTLRNAGITALQEAISTLAPEFADRVDQLQDWSQVALLSVESSRLPRWYRPGLLFIGDAAHVMSPVGGVGINYAIQDAVVATNLLSAPLKAGQVRVDDLAAVQRQREFPTRIIQGFQSLIQQQIVKGALNPDQDFKPPAFLSLPLLRDIPARLIGLGVSPVHLHEV